MLNDPLNPGPPDEEQTPAPPSTLAPFGATAPALPPISHGMNVSGGAPQPTDPNQPAPEPPKPATPHPDGKEAFHNRLRDFGQTDSDITGKIIDITKHATDYSNPDEYSKQLGMLHQAQGDNQAEKVHYEKQHPWGSVESAHPGVFGKVGHVLGEIGNVAGAALAPEVAVNVPGSEMNLTREENRGQAEEKAGVGEATAEEKAQAAATGAEAKVTAAGAAKTTADTKADTSDRATAVKENTLQNQLGEAVKNGDVDGAQKILDTLKQEKAAQTQPHLQSVQGTVNGKPSFANHDPATGQYTDPNTHQVIPNFTPEPKQPAAGTLVINPENKVQQLKPGMTVEPGTQNVGGFAGMNRPTTQMRNVDAQAQVASQGIPDVVSEIQRLGPSLGPVAGRWNDFMQGKVGADNPDFAGLRADLLMVASAVALAHARGRLPENLRQEFDNMINAPKQTPENLVTVLSHVKVWMDRMGQMGQTPGGGTTPPPAAPPTDAGDPLGILPKPAGK